MGVDTLCLACPLNGLNVLTLKRIQQITIWIYTCMKLCSTDLKYQTLTAYKSLEHPHWRSHGDTPTPTLRPNKLAHFPPNFQLPK